MGLTWVYAWVNIWVVTLAGGQRERRLDMATYQVHFTSVVQAYVPVDAESEQEAMQLFDDGKVGFGEMFTVYSETGDAEYAELED